MDLGANNEVKPYASSSDDGGKSRWANVLHLVQCCLDWPAYTWGHQARSATKEWKLEKGWVRRMDENQIYGQYLPSYRGSSEGCDYATDMC